MKQKQEAKQIKRLKRELNRTKADLKEAVEQWGITHKLLGASKEENENKEAVIKKLMQLKDGEIVRFQKMLEKADNRFLQALDIISSLEEENAKLKKIVN